MIGAIVQPYFFPYVNYYKLVYLTDLLVFLDDVNYIKRGYINRNSILHNGNPHKFTMPVTKISQNKTIQKHYYTGETRQFLNLLRDAYCHAPYYEEVISVINRVVHAPELNVAKRNSKSIEYVFEYLGIKKNFLFSSDIQLDSNYKGQDRIVQICKYLNFNIYINPRDGKNLYDATVFNEHEIYLKFLQNSETSYKQGKSKFTSNLSVIDILMWCDKSKIISTLEDASVE